MAIKWKLLSGTTQISAGTSTTDSGTINAVTIPKNTGDKSIVYNFVVEDSSDPSCSGSTGITVPPCGSGCDCATTRLSPNYLTFGCDETTARYVNISTAGEDCINNVVCTKDGKDKDNFDVVYYAANGIRINPNSKNATTTARTMTVTVNIYFKDSPHDVCTKTLSVTQNGTGSTKCNCNNISLQYNILSFDWDKKYLKGNIIFGVTTGDSCVKTITVEKSGDGASHFDVTSGVTFYEYYYYYIKVEPKSINETSKPITCNTKVTITLNDNSTCVRNFIVEHKGKEGTTCDCNSITLDPSTGLTFESGETTDKIVNVSATDSCIISAVTIQKTGQYAEYFEGSVKNKTNVYIRPTSQNASSSPRTMTVKLTVTFSDGATCTDRFFNVVQKNDENCTLEKITESFVKVMDNNTVNFTQSDTSNFKHYDVNESKCSYYISNGDDSKSYLWMSDIEYDETKPANYDVKGRYLHAWIPNEFPEGLSEKRMMRINEDVYYMITVKKSCSADSSRPILSQNSINHMYNEEGEYEISVTMGVCWEFTNFGGNDSPFVEKVYDEVNNIIKITVYPHEIDSSYTFRVFFKSPTVPSYYIEITINWAIV